ncbi:MAG: InlB B-repeat-containing protein, partial [Clostridiales bacterium]|nr:InlB B-repeat-containing protein [Candidatus Crickella caballi]
MENKVFRKAIALIVSGVLVVTSMTFIGSNNLKAADEEAANQVEQVADEATDKEAETAPAENPSTSNEKIDLSNDASEAKPEKDAADDSQQVAEEVKEEATTEAAEEAAEEETEEAEMPAQSFEQTASNGIRVVVSAPEGAFPEGTEMKVSAISHAKAVSLLEDDVENVKDANGVDITFYCDGKEIQPEKKIAVKLSNANVEGKEFNIYHVEDNGDVEKVKSGVSSSGGTFNAESFSIYVVVGEDEDETPYTAKYTFKNGSEEVDVQIVKDGDTLNKPEAPEKEGYKFVGWYDGDKEFTDFGTQTVSENSEITLNAKFQEAHYVFFKHPGGGIYTTKEGVSGDEISTSDVIINISASSSAYKWYTDEACTKQVPKVTLADSDVYLYTKAETGHWLTFDSNGGSFVSSEFVEANESTIKPADPTRLGYTFAGWKLNGLSYTFGKPLSETTTVTASWTPKTTNYTVIHWQENANDDGYSFKESETKSGTTGQETVASTKNYEGFTPQEIKQETISGDGSTIVNVYYNRTVYTLTFKGNSGQATCGKEEHIHSFFRGCYNIRGKLICKKEEHTHTAECYGSGSYTITAKFGAKIADEFNADFFKETYAGRAWKATSVYDYALQTLDVMPMANVTFNLYQQSSNTLKTIYYYGESLPDEKVDKTTGGKNYTLLKSVGTYFNYMTYNEEYHDIEGFSRWSQSDAGFSGGSKEFSNNEGELYYDRNSYNIVFMNNGTKEKTVSKKYEASITDANYTPDRPSNVPDVYKFGGWYDNQLCEGDAYSFNGKTMPANNITLYAKWVVPEEHVIVYVSFSGDSENYTVPYGQKINSEWLTPPTDIPEGSTFVGWGTKAEDGSMQLFDTNQPIYNDIELFPICSDNSKTYKVKYSANGGRGSVTDNETYHKLSRAAIKSAKSLTAPTGKVFIGWNTADDGSGTMYQPGDKIMIDSSDITLYAQWDNKVEDITLVYHSNYPAGGNTEDKQKLKNNEKIKLPTPEVCGFETPKGYEFEGWSLTPGGAVKYKAGQKVLVDNLPDNDLYAKWKCIEVTVKITGNTDTKTYNGSNQSATGFTTNIGDKDIRISLKEGKEAKATGKNVGEYPMNLTADDFVATSDTYGEINIVVVADGNLTIEKRAVTLTSASGEKKYDGQPLTKNTQSDVAVGGDGFAEGEGASYDITGTQTDAGSSENKFTYKLNEGTLADNYTITTANGTLTVEKADKLVIKVTGNSDEKVYTGREQSATGYTIGKYDEKDVTITKQPEQSACVAKGTNAGKYDMGLTAADFAATSKNYKTVEFEVEAGELVIKKLNISVKATGGEKQYDGTALTAVATGYWVPSGKLADGQSMTVGLSGSRTEVGSSDAVVGDVVIKAGAEDVTGNYEIEKLNGTLTITPADKLVIKVTGNSDTKVYNGQEQSVTGYTIENYDENDVTITEQPEQSACVAKGTNAGKYDMGLKASDFEATSKNYKTVEFEVTDGWLKIEKADSIEVEVLGNTKTETYDG